MTIEHLDRVGRIWAQEMVTRHHYRHAPVDARACPEAWAVCLDGVGPVGCLIACRPEATRNYPWYGSLADVASGKAGHSYWEVVNLARVWLSPIVQRGGEFCRPDLLPGYTDPGGVWCSSLASAAIRLFMRRVGADYLLARPPVWVEQPYRLRWLLSYCDTRHHRGTLYKAAGFAHYRTNRAGIQTWRVRLPGPTRQQDAAIREAAEWSARSRRFRVARASHQPALFEVA